MSKAESPETAPFAENMDRTEVLEMLETAMQQAHEKVENGRIRDEGKEKVRIQWIKAVGYLANQHRQIQRDKDLEELQRDVEELQAERGL